MSLGTGKELARNWQELARKRAEDGRFVGVASFFEATLAKNAQKRQMFGLQGPKRCSEGPRATEKGPGGVPERPKGPLGGSRGSPGGQKGQNVLFLGSHFGLKMGHNPLKANLEIIKKQLRFIIFLAYGGPRGRL